MSGFENWKTPCKVKRENLVSLPLTGAARVWDGRDSWPLRDWRSSLDSLIKTHTRRAWKGFRLVCFLLFCFLFSRFQELFLLVLISCWVDLLKGWTNVVYFSVKICEKFANYQNIKQKKNMDIWCMEATISMRNLLQMWLKYAVSVFGRFSSRYFGICHFF